MLMLPLVLFMAFGLGACSGSDAPYPNKEITIMIPWAPGGATDLLMRAMVNPVKQSLGTSVTINVKNVVGGAGTVGTAEAAKAKADGYMPLYTFAGPMTTQPHLQKLPYDPLTDFVPVSGVVKEIFSVVVKGDAPYKNMQEMVAYFKQPGKELRYATSGAGTINHMCGIMLSRQASITMTHVPYKSSTEAVNAVLGDTVEASIAEPPAYIAAVQEKRAKLLMILGDKRYEDLSPGIPSSKESGYDLPSGGWAAVYVQKGTPQAIVDRLAKAFQKAMDDPEVKTSLANQQQPAWLANGTEVMDVLKRDYQLFGEILKAEGLAK